VALMTLHISRRNGKKGKTPGLNASRVLITASTSSVRLLCLVLGSCDKPNAFHTLQAECFWDDDTENPIEGRD
jgi:hypothetical protein